MGSVSRGELPPEPEETDPLLDELDQAARMAKKALGDLAPAGEDTERDPEKGGSGQADQPETEPADAAAPTDPVE